MTSEIRPFEYRRWLRLTRNEPVPDMFWNKSLPAGTYIHTDVRGYPDPTYAYGYDVVVGQCDRKGLPSVEYVFAPQDTLRIASHTLSFEFGDPFPGQAVEEPFFAYKDYQLVARRDYQWQECDIRSPFDGKEHRVDMVAEREWRINTRGARIGRNLVTVQYGLLSPFQRDYSVRQFMPHSVVCEVEYVPPQTRSSHVADPELWTETTRSFFKRDSFISYVTDAQGNLVLDSRSRRLVADKHYRASESLGSAGQLAF